MARPAGLAVIALAVAALVLGVAAAPPKQVIRVDQPWTCSSKVDLDLVRVTITPASIGPRKGEDAIHLANGCTGRIGRLEVVQWAGDGVKVSDGAADLDVDGGSIECLGKAPTLHQDGIQVMGGARITFTNLKIDCGRKNARLINSELFINQAGKSTMPPTDVVCDHCSFGAWAAHTVSVQNSIRSGVTNSTICVARYPQFTLAVGAAAVDPVNASNSVRQCGPGKLVLDPGNHTVVYGRRLTLTGTFLGQMPGSPIAAQARPRGARRFVPVGSTTSGKSGRFRLVLKPTVSGVVQLVTGGRVHAKTAVGVRPKVVLKSHRWLVAKVFAARSYAGLKTMLQEQRNGRWVDLKPVKLGKRSKAVIQLHVHGVAIRLAVPAVRGYLPATSAPVALP